MWWLKKVSVCSFTTHFARSLSWYVSQITQSVRGDAFKPTYLTSHLMEWFRMMWFLDRVRFHKMEWHLDGMRVLPSFRVQIGITTLSTFGNTLHVFYIASNIIGTILTMLFECELVINMLMWFDHITSMRHILEQVTLYTMSQAPLCIVPTSRA